MFRNWYYCKDCNEYWEDVWDSMCDDRCPACDVSITPYQSDVLDEINY